MIGRKQGPAPRPASYRHVRTLAILTAGASLLIFMTACPNSANQGRRSPSLPLELVGSAQLPGPATGMSADRDGLLLVDNSGTEIYRLDFNLKPQPSIALGSRMSGIRGLAADAFFVYLYDDKHVYRFDRASGEIAQVTSGIDCQSAVVMAGGELALIDGAGDRILLLDPSQNVTTLNTDYPGLQPAALAVGNDGNFQVLNRTRREVVVLSRIGEMVRSFAVPGTGVRIAVDDSLRLYVLERTGTRIWQISPNGRTVQVDATQLSVNFVGSEIVLFKNWLFVLDHDSRVLKFRIPQIPG